jgi:hypothetical protein
MLCAALLFLFPFSLPAQAGSTDGAGVASLSVATTTPTPIPTPTPEPEPCDCGRLSIAGPLYYDDDRMVGFSMAGGDLPGSFKWTVDEGEIVSGQGSRSIIVKMRQTRSYVLRITVAIAPLSAGCTCPIIDRTFDEMRATASYLQGEIQGKVLSSGRSGKPIADALVELLYEGDVKDSVQTDAKGQYSFGPIAADDVYTIRASSGGLSGKKIVKTKANKRVSVPSIKLAVP